MKKYQKKSCCCDMRGYLSFLILFLLSKKPQSGNEIAKEIERRKGEMPSPGTIYPALKALKEFGAIKEEKKGKAIIYTLTKEGEISLKIAKEQFCKTFKDIF